MDICDFTGETDFNCFDITPSPRGSHSHYLERDVQQDFKHLLGRDLHCGSDYNAFCRTVFAPPCSCTTEEIYYQNAPGNGNDREETSVSQAFPPRYPVMKPPDPLSFLKSRDGTGSRSTRGTATARQGQQRGVTGTASKKGATTLFEPLQCCNHDDSMASRRFFLQFNPTDAEAAAARSDRCYAAERDRCNNFWKFVYETPELEALIKQGKFFFTSPLRNVSCNEPGKPVTIRVPQASTKHIPRRSKTKKKSDSEGAAPSKPKSKYTPEMEELRKRNIAIHKEERRRRDVLRRRLEQITVHENFIPKQKNLPDPAQSSSLPEPATEPEFIDKLSASDKSMRNPDDTTPISITATSEMATTPDSANVEVDQMESAK